MSLFRTYKRTRFFLWINITGLAIGLAVSIMLILFVVNELSYDKHFADHDRIVKLNTVIEENGEKEYSSLSFRKAYDELPEKVPGIEAAVQLYKMWQVEVINDMKQYPHLRMIYADSTFFDVFQMKFIEGTPATALHDKNTIVLTKPYAEIIFGSPENAMDKILTIDNLEYTVSGIVEPLPSHSHFAFDILGNLSHYHWLEHMVGPEFYTYYLIEKDASRQNVRKNIEEEYSRIIEPYAKQMNAKGSGQTEMLTDIYLHSQAGKDAIGRTNSMQSLVLLVLLSLLVLLLAVANFINLFMAQGEMRMKQVGIRKTNGAYLSDIVKLFFSEVSAIVAIAFLAGFVLAIFFTPSFSNLVDRQIDLTQLLNPVFILCIIGLFLITVICAASYPSFYLSRFTPLEILNKRVRFSKQKLSAVVLCFQTIVTVILITYILIIHKQAGYLENIPLGYNPERVMVVKIDNKVAQNYKAIRQELFELPGVEGVSGGEHIIGASIGSKIIAPTDNRDAGQAINEYRVIPGLCELMKFELVEGEFFKEDASDAVYPLVINQAAVKTLNFEQPIIGSHIWYDNNDAEIIGVVKDFVYGDPAGMIQPLVLSDYQAYPYLLYVKYNNTLSRMEVEENTQEVIRRFKPDFIINPVFTEDIYREKFDAIKTYSKLIFIGSLLSVFIAMMGLLAIHLYTSMRRTKEIGIRRVNGATKESIFTLLTKDVLKWIVIASVIAIPFAYYIISNWLSNYTNNIGLSWLDFVFPVLIQCTIAILTISGVIMKVLSRNPVEALKIEN